MMSSVDPFGSEYRADPGAVLARLRADEPVVRVAALDAYLVTRHDLVTQVIDDPATYSNERPPDGLGAAPDPAVRARLAEVRSQGWPHVPAIADQDEPLHHAFRTIVAPFFTPSRLRPFAGDIASICDRLIDDFAGRPTVDFIEAFAGPLPLHVIALVLRLGESTGPEQLARFARWRDSAVASVGASLSVEELVRAETDVVEMQHYLADRLDRAADADDDVFGALRRARIGEPDGGERPLELAESLTILRQVFIGGIETTTKALAETMLQLASQPDVYARLADEPDLRRRVVEESLRLSSPAQGILRTVTTPAELAGVPLAVGDRIFVMFAAANRDDDAFGASETFDATRSGLGRHLAFGRGAHVCLGAALARIEMQVALERLSARIRYRIRADQPIEYNASFLLRGPLQVHMDVEIERTPARSVPLLDADDEQSRRRT